MVFLSILFLMILLAPLCFKIVEQHLELFLLLSGVIAIIGTNQFTFSMIKQTLLSPLAITCAVFIASTMFMLFQARIIQGIQVLHQQMHKRLFYACVPFVLGLLSSVITAIIATLLLLAIVNAIPLKKQEQVRFVVFSCFAIGIGAVLTPIGEPLSTIVTAQLNVSPTYLFYLLSSFVLASILFLSLLVFLTISSDTNNVKATDSIYTDTFQLVIFRTLKVYVFVMALSLLGKSFLPYIADYMHAFTIQQLYWINVISAVLDNATLAAAEMSPNLETDTIHTILISLLISGGMMIQGNLPNIIAAKHLNITSVEWARVGIPLGMFFLLIYYFVFLHF